MPKRENEKNKTKVDIEKEVPDYVELQTQLERQLFELCEVRGVGLSYNKKTKNPAFKVFLSDIEQASELPDTIEQVGIQYEQAEDIDAYDK